MGFPHAVVIASTSGPHTATPPGGPATRSAALPPRSGSVLPGPLLGR